MACDARWLIDGTATVWLAHQLGATLTLSKWQEGSAESDPWQVSGDFGWDATVDHKGALWVTWSEEGLAGPTVYVQRNSDGVWGPRFQISTTGSATRPIITPDEYANVWIFWERKTEGSDIVMCRMGPRSGHETLVARDASMPRSAATRQGVLYVTFGEHNLYAVTGTEQQGFGKPVRVNTG